MKNGNLGSCDLKKTKIKKKAYMKSVSIFLCSLVVLLSGILAFDKRWANILGKEQNVETDNKELNYTRTTELDDIEMKNAKKEIALISETINNIIGEKSEYYGIFYYDINTGVHYSLNPDTKFHAASTIKVPIAMMVSDKLTNKETTLNTKIAYEKSDYATGAGILQWSIEEGQALPLKKLLETMIVESDNIATYMLKKTLSSVPEYVTKNTDIEMQDNTNIVTPRQMAIMLRELYTKSYENNYYRDVIKLMLRTSSHDRLDKYVPRNIVAHKIGDYEQYVNDIGIVFTDKPYIICIYTNSQMEEGRENIAKISKSIYDIKTNTNN